MAPECQRPPCPKITADDLGLPAEALAFLLLPLLPDQAFRRTQLILTFLPDPERQPGYLQVTEKSLNDRGAAELAEALSFLEAAGLIVQWPPEDPRYSHSGQADMFHVTRLGHQAKAQGPNARLCIAHVGGWGSICTRIYEIAWSPHSALALSSKQR